MVVILHNIRSLHNVGSIFRTCDAAGVEKLYLCGITPRPIDQFGRFRPQLTKVSLGAEKTVAWDGSARSPQAIAKLIKRLKEDGYKIFAVEQDKNSIPYYKLKLFDSAQGKNKSKCAFIFGNEVKGLPPSVLKNADKILEIPMRGQIVRQAHHPRRIRFGKESLNIAVSVGIVLFHIRQQGR